MFWKMRLTEYNIYIIIIVLMVELFVCSLVVDALMARLINASLGI